MAGYGWIITKDHLDGEAEGVMGLSPDAESGTHTRLLNGEGFAFRLLDDDGITVAEGLFIGDDETEDAFAPLDDFGEANWGCTRIKYKIGRHWEEV